MIPLTQSQKEMALSLAYEGKNIKEIEQMIETTRARMAFALSNDTDFETSFARARQFGLDSKSDELLTITTDEPDVQKARLMSDNLKWMLSKRIPSVYGDRLDMNVTNNVDLNSALEAARARALPIRDQHRQIDAQATDYIDITPHGATDSKSVEAEKVSNTPDADVVRKDGIFE